jgi:enoyl-CoA hydratase
VPAVAQPVTATAQIDEGGSTIGPFNSFVGRRTGVGMITCAAVEGFAVVGGLELALWRDFRVTARDATFGAYCRRFGVPLMNLGTIRLLRVIGQSRAMDMILTSRRVSDEASPTASSSPVGRWRNRCGSRTNLHACRRPPCATTGARPLTSGRPVGTRRRSTNSGWASPRSRRARPKPGRGASRRRRPPWKTRVAATIAACVARKPHAATIDTKAAGSWPVPASIEPKCSGHFGHSLGSARVPEICCAISR